MCDARKGEPSIVSDVRGGGGWSGGANLELL